MPPRHDSTYTLPSLNVGVLLQENGDSLLTEDGLEILLENPAQDPNLSARNTSTFNSNPTRN